jgi:hypothetical protein
MGCGASKKYDYGSGTDEHVSSASQCLEKMEIQDLKTLLAEHNVSSEGCFSKREMIQALVDCMGVEAAVVAADERFYIPARKPGNKKVQESDVANRSQGLPQLPWKSAGDGNDAAQGVSRDSHAQRNSPVIVRPDSLADARQVLKLLGELLTASERLEKLLTREAEALEKRRICQSPPKSVPMPYKPPPLPGHGNWRNNSSISVDDVQVSKDRAIAIGMLTQDAQLEESRLRSMIKEVENGAMRLAEVQLPELVGPILEQLQGLLANMRLTNMNVPPAIPPRPLPPPPLHLGGQIAAIGRLQKEIASEEDASRLRLLALTND